MTPVVDICHCAALRKATRRVTQLYDNELATVDLTAGQFAILAELNRQGADGIELWELADLLVLERSALARNLRLLMRHELVAVSAPRQDLRRRLVVLTDTGRARFAHARPAWQAAQDRMTVLLGADASLLLRQLLAVAKSAQVDASSTPDAHAPV